MSSACSICCLFSVLRLLTAALTRHIPRQPPVPDRMYQYRVFYQQQKPHLYQRHGCLLNVRFYLGIGRAGGTSIWSSVFPPSLLTIVYVYGIRETRKQWRRLHYLQVRTTAPEFSPLNLSFLMHAGSARDHRPLLKLEIAPDDLAEHKRRLLGQNGACAEYDMPLKHVVEVLQAARIVSLSKVRTRTSAALSMLPFSL